MDPPTSALYCPVCSRELEFITVWQEPGANRIRLFCEQCSHLPAYRVLPKPQPTILDAQGFQHFAAGRQLHNAWLKEHEQAPSGSGGAG